MKYLLILLTIGSLTSFLLATDFSSPNGIKNYKKIDKHYEKLEVTPSKDCDSCGTPATVYPYNGEDIPIAKTFPCSKIKGCLHPLIEKKKKD